MAKINGKIPQQWREIIRDRIAQILLDEVPNQYDLYIPAELESEPINKVLNISKIWVDRTAKLNIEEKQLINVLFVSSDFADGITHSEQSDGDNTFFIDCYARGEGNDASSAAQNAKARATRLAGVVWAILSSPEYIRLDFPPPSIKRRKVLRIEASMPTPENDSEGSSVCRIIFSVEVPEEVEPIEPTVMGENYTTVKLFDTELGYFYEWNNS